MLDQDVWLREEQTLELRIIKMEKGLKKIIDALHVPYEDVFSDAKKYGSG